MKRIFSIVLLLVAAFLFNSCSKSEIETETISLDIIGQWVSSIALQDSYEVLDFQDKSNLSITVRKDDVITTREYTYRFVKEHGYVWLEYEGKEDSKKFKYCIYKFNQEEMHLTTYPILGEWYMVYCRNQIVNLDDVNR